MSASRFGLVFRQTTGLTPYQYVLGLRIERAKSLLAATKHTIGDIAQLSGFYDQSQFTRQFKKRVGLLPKEYANNFRD